MELFCCRCGKIINEAFSVIYYYGQSSEIPQMQFYHKEGCPVLNNINIKDKKMNNE